MYKLTAVLCAAMFGVWLIAGEDRGQLRPGLANAPVGVAATAAVAQPQPASMIAAPDAAPAEIAAISAPVAVQSPTTPETNAAIEETVFSLATYSDAAPAALVTAEPQASGDLAFVVAASVNVREGPGRTNPVLTRLSRGEAVTIVSTDDTGWARIRIEGDGLEGFMALEYLSSTAP